VSLVWTPQPDYVIRYRDLTITIRRRRRHSGVECHFSAPADAEIRIDKDDASCEAESDGVVGFGSSPGNTG